MKIKSLIKSHEFVLGILICIYIAYFTVASFLRYDNFYTGRYDLGNMDQTVWNTVNGRIFQSFSDNGLIISRLSAHADFMLILLSPLYLLWSHPKTLLLTQTIILALGAIFIFLIAKSILKNKHFALIFSFLFLMSPALQYTNLYDFHAVTLATTLLLASFYFLIKRNYLLMTAFLILSGITKEQVWIATSIFGIPLFFEKAKRTKTLGLLIIITFLALFFYLVSIVIPQNANGQHFALSYYSEFGNSPIEVIKNVSLSPHKIFLKILEDGRIEYIKQLFIPLGFVSLLSPLYLAFAVPDLLINLLSNNTQLHQIYYQYSAVITPFIFVSAIFGVRKLIKLFPKIPKFYFYIYLIFFTILSAYLFGPLPLAKNASIDMFVKPLPNKTVISEFLDGIPKRYSIAATNNLGSHLSRRQKIFTIPVGIDRADIILFLLNDSFAQPTLDAQKDIAEKLKKDKNYVEIFKHDDFIVFEKRNLHLQKKPTQVKLFALSIETLQHRDYIGSEIKVEKDLPPSILFSSSIVSYMSDGLKLYALLNIPKTKMPKEGYPVIVLNHGYISPKNYDTVSSYKTIADWFASNGFMVLKPDFRGNGQSEVVDTALMRFAYPIDVLNLVTSIGNLSNANANKIYLWGHSMGGEVTLKVLEVMGKKPELVGKIRGAVLWAPVTDPIKWFEKSHLGLLPEAKERPYPYFTTFKILGSPADNPKLWSSLSPLLYLSDIKIPVQIDHGTDDQTVPYQWSIELFNDLLSMNKKSQLKLYQDDDHNLSNNQLNVLQSDLLFFQSL